MLDAIHGKGVTSSTFGSASRKSRDDAIRAIRAQLAELIRLLIPHQQESKLLALVNQVAAVQDISECAQHVADGGAFSSMEVMMIMKLLGQISLVYVNGTGSVHDGLPSFAMQDLWSMCLHALVDSKVDFVKKLFDKKHLQHLGGESIWVR